jgi:peptide/nickel transport system ATP-binding protein
MRQRAMIAMALACRPKVLIADEPTTALDVTIQAQILDLIGELQREFGTAVILITHDLGVVAETAQRVVVMYAGRKVEEAPVAELFARPLHPYMRGLLGSIPRVGAIGNTLQEIPGMVPPLSDLPDGCAFAPRCGLADDRCPSGVRRSSVGRRDRQQLHLEGHRRQRLVLHVRQKAPVEPPQQRGVQCRQQERVI